MEQGAGADDPRRAARRRRRRHGPAVQHPGEGHRRVRLRRHHRGTRDLQGIRPGRSRRGVPQGWLGRVHRRPRVKVLLAQVLENSSSEFITRATVVLREELGDGDVLLAVLLHHLGHRHLEVLLGDVDAPLAQREHARLRAHRLALRPRRASHLARNLLEVDAPHQVHLPRVDLEDVHAAVLRGVGELDLAVDASRAEQGAVQDVQAVRRHDHLDLVARLEAVELVEELEHGALHLRVPAARAARAADGVNLVHEKNSGRVLPGHHEQLAHHPGTLADVLLHELGTRDADEATVGVVRHRAGEQRLSGTRGTVQDHTLGLSDAEGLEQLGVLDGQLDNLLDLLDLLVQAADHVKG